MIHDFLRGSAHIGSVDPVGNCLVIDGEVAPDGAKARTVLVKIQRLFADFIRVAIKGRRERITAPAGLAKEALRAVAIMSRFDLLL